MILWIPTVLFSNGIVLNNSDSENFADMGEYTCGNDSSMIELQRFPALRGAW